IVDHARRLHEGVTDGGPNETKSALLERLAHGVRFRAGCGNILQGTAGIDLGCAADKLPDVASEAAAFLLYGQEGAGVADGGFDFQAIADDPRIGEQLFDLSPIVTGDLFRIEIVEGGTKSFALAKDDLPAQAGLRGVQDQKLEKLAVILERYAPFAIVIGNRDRTRRPSASNP